MLYWQITDKYSNLKETKKLVNWIHCNLIDWFLDNEIMNF